MGQSVLVGVTDGKAVAVGVGVAVGVSVGVAEAVAVFVGDAVGVGVSVEAGTNAKWIPLTCWPLATFTTCPVPEAVYPAGGAICTVYVCGFKPFSP
jgi:hypothetical protein